MTAKRGLLDGFGNEDEADTHINTIFFPCSATFLTITAFMFSPPLRESAPRTATRITQTEAPNSVLFPGTNTVIFQGDAELLLFHLLV